MVDARHDPGAFFHNVCEKPKLTDRAPGFRFQARNRQRRFRLGALDDLICVGFYFRSDAFEKCGLIGGFQLTKERKSLGGKLRRAIYVLAVRRVKEILQFFAGSRIKSLERITAGRCILNSDERLAENVH